MKLYFIANLGLVLSDVSVTNGLVIDDTDLDLTADTVKVYFSNGNTGTPISIETAMLNFSEFTVVNQHLKTSKANVTNLTGNTALLDSTTPMSFIRANTVVNFGRL